MDIKAVQGAKLFMSDAEVDADFSAARLTRGVWLGEKAIYFIDDTGLKVYALREEFAGGSWMNSPRLCGA